MEKEKADKLEKERLAAKRAVLPSLSEGIAHTESLQVSVFVARSTQELT